MVLKKGAGGNVRLISCFFSHCFKRLEERNFQVVSVLDKSERKNINLCCLWSFSESPMGKTEKEQSSPGVSEDNIFLEAAGSVLRHIHKKVVSTLDGL